MLIFSNNFEKVNFNTFYQYTMTKSMDTHCNTQYISHITNITLQLESCNVPTTDRCNDIFEVCNGWFTRFQDDIVKEEQIIHQNDSPSNTITNAKY